MFVPRFGVEAGSPCSSTTSLDARLGKAAAGTTCMICSEAGVPQVSGWKRAALLKGTGPHRERARLRQVGVVASRLETSRARLLTRPWAPSPWMI